MANAVALVEWCWDNDRALQGLNLLDVRQNSKGMKAELEMDGHDGREPQGHESSWADLEDI